MASAMMSSSDWGHVSSARDVLLVPYGDDCLAIDPSGHCTVLGSQAPRPGSDQIERVVELGLPASTWAAAPDTVAALVNEVLTSPGRRLLELGPGLSTVAVALAADFAGIDIGVVGVEQDRDWADAVVAALPDSAHVDASMVLAPLVPADAAAAPFPVSRWYDLAALASVAGPFDVVFVDGPTAYLAEWRYDRWPALDFVRPLLADRATIVLDDATREGERAIGRDWLDRLGDGWQASMVDRSLWLRHGQSD